MEYTTNYNLKKPNGDAFYDVKDNNDNADIIDTELKDVNDNLETKVDKIEGKGLSANDYTDAEKSKLAAVDEHANLTDNPHAVTKSQVGLGNVDNTADVNKPVSDEQQTAINATYQQATGYADTKIANLINGAPSTLDTLKEIADAMVANDNVVKALDTAIGTKAAQAQVDGHINNSVIHVTATERTNWDTAYTHSQKTSGNPHGVSKLDVGLGNVANVATNNQTPTYTEATDLSELVSGETMSKAFGKLKLVVKNVISMAKLLGSTDISNIGDGTITGVITDINSNLTVNLGAYTELTSNNIYPGRDIVVSGGYYKIGKIAIVTFIITSNTTVTTVNSALLRGLPKPAAATNITVRCRNHTTNTDFDAELGSGGDSGDTSYFYAVIGAGQTISGTHTYVRK